MVLLKNIAALWHNRARRHRLSLTNTSNNEEMWYTHISPRNIVMAGIGVAILSFIIVLAIVAYSPILEFLPGYRSDALKARESIVKSFVKIDSLEQVIDKMSLYTDNVALIMEGKVPTILDNMELDSLALSKSILLPNSADSILRAQMEGKGRYNIAASGYTAATAMVTPVDGIVSRHFNISEHRYGVEVVVSAYGRVMATQAGVVAFVEWTPEKGNIVGVMHAHNTLSIYRNVESVVVNSGATVRAGEVIGYNGEEQREEQATSRVIGFELWREGRPVDPEEYIIF